MHACGHDMHTAILLGALKILNRHRDLFCGTVFGLFQPGEELNPGGASLVMRERPFDGYRVAAFVGQHVEPMLKTGTFGFRRGKYMASSDELRFRVNGVGGHAALRERIKDPVRAAAELIRLLYDIPAANPSPELPTIVSIGRVTADGATNVVPDRTFMEGTMRTFDETWRRRVKEMVHEAAAEVDARFGVSTEVDINHGYPCVYNDEELTRRGGRRSVFRQPFGGPDTHGHLPSRREGARLRCGAVHQYRLYRSWLTMLTKARIRQVRSLSDKTARSENGLFVAEGRKMVGEALAAGADIERIYLTGSP